MYDGATLTLKPKIAYMQDKVAQRHDKPNSPFQAEGTEQASCWNAVLWHQGPCCSKADNKPDFLFQLSGTGHYS